MDVIALHRYVGEDDTADACTMKTRMTINF